MLQIKDKPNYLAVVIGIIAMIALSVLSILLLPLFIINEYLNTEYTKALMIILIAIISFCSTLIAGMVSKTMNMWEPLLLACIYCIVILFVSIALFDGVSMGTLYRIIACGVSCVAAYLVLKRTKKPHTKRKKRRGHG